MLQSVLPPEAYLSEEILELEKERIFKKMWIFAGLKTTLASRNAFLTRNIVGVPVVVTTPDGVNLRAYENLCAHRQMPIQTAAFGKRGLVCPYHAWSYTAEEGALKGVANASLYEMRGSEKQSIRLREFAVKAIGNMIFVNLDENPMPIEEQFTEEFLGLIQNASSHFDSSYAYSVFDVKYNWKLNFENILDFNHLPFIHPESFYAIADKDGFIAGSNRPESEIFPEDVSWDREQAAVNGIRLSDLSYPSIGSVNIEQRWFTNLVRRYGEDRSHYYNWYVYPNLNFGGVVGEYFYLQQYMPISPGVMRYHMWVVMAERLNKRQDFTALLRELMEGEKKVIDEDTVFLENMQANLHRGAPQALHGRYEFPLYRLGRWYRDNILQTA